MSSILCAMAGTALGLVGVCRWGKKLMIRQELKSRVDRHAQCQNATPAMLNKDAVERLHTR